MDTVLKAPRCYSYIRFSTPEQEKGDSLRRQLEASEAYAAEKGLALDDTVKMEDRGLSAFKGEHRTRGALGQFIKLVDAGKIAKGSTLIVESLDRLSREEVFDALSRFMDIIGAGIKVVTLADRMEYIRDSINANLGMQLMFSLVSLGRGHEESLMKSKRVGAAWDKKRQSMGEKKLTARCPAWLKLNRSKTEFIPMPDRVKQIERIYKMAKSGIGARRIMTILNEQGRGWIPAHGWHESYLKKILSTRAVIGEFQPHKGHSSERTPHGEPVRNYFPRIISEELFYSVQRTGERYFGGRNGKISSLFGGLAKCGYCHGPMRFVNKGSGTYLICDNATRGIKCKRHAWRYLEFERLVLHYCKGLEVADLLRDEETAEVTEVDRLLDEMAALNGNLSRLAKREKNMQEKGIEVGGAATRPSECKTLAVP